MKFNDYNKKLGNINKDSAVINLNYYKKIKNNYPLLFEQQNNNILFQVFSDNYQLILFYVYNGMIIGEMINTLSEYPVEGAVWIKKSFQNKGLGSQFYHYIIQNYNGIISDNNLTGQKGSGIFHVWKKLSTIYKGFIYDISTKNPINGPKIFEKSDVIGSDKIRFLILK